MMMMMLMLSMMVGVRVVQMDPSFEVVIEPEGGQTSTAEGWMARSTSSSLAHQLIKIK
jgi:hypothetical protein